MEDRPIYKVGLSEQDLKEIEERVNRFEMTETGLWEVPVLYTKLAGDASSLLAEVRRLRAKNAKLEEALEGISTHLGELLTSL